MVQGNVWLPGPIGFTPGMTLGDAIRLAGGPKPDVFLGDVLVTRLQPDSTRIQLRSALADSTGLPVNNFALADDDEVTVFSRSEFRSDRYVVITGAVRKQGRLPYSEGMTLRDAALLADGLREDAFLDYAEVARLPKNRAGGQVATSIRVPLDSTYIFDRAANGKYLGPTGPAGTGFGRTDVRAGTVRQRADLRAAGLGTAACGRADRPGPVSRSIRTADSE